eukprot:gnl/MRDRNA2_/MRDRNA2_110975_c0_seq1.p1 gnl/MRDRNA2_/MRDRNA2_110975_c0~~gnl/MRDRNA2_/MRDRNA2_110975_c0_seq1.p1  ORF type:complete len:347 (+),score=50.64 gnl/MRDRNA2_/MRDRNA2_110975_c0_seq1:87-1043(+)
MTESQTENQAEPQPNKTVKCLWHGLPDSLLRASAERSSPPQPIPVVLILDDPDMQFGHFGQLSMIKRFADARKEGTPFLELKQSFDRNVAGRTQSQHGVCILPLPLVEFTPIAQRRDECNSLNDECKHCEDTIRSSSDVATANEGLRFDQLPDRLIAAGLEFARKLDLASVAACSRTLHEAVETEGRFAICGAFRAVRGIERLDPGLNPQLVSAAMRTARGVPLPESTRPFELAEVIISRPRSTADEYSRGTKAHFIACPLNGPDPQKIEVLMQDLGLVPLEYIVDTKSEAPFTRSSLSQGLHGPLPHRVRLKKRNAD